MAYGDYTAGDPTTVPGTTEAALYNVPPDMAAVVVKMTPEQGRKARPAPAPVPGVKGGTLSGVLNTVGEASAIPEDQTHKDWTATDLVTYDKMLAKMGLMSGSDRGMWQKRMWDAGMYKKTQTYTSQAFDEETQGAWSEVVERAAKENKSITEVLDEGADAVAKAGGTDAFYKKARGQGQQPLVTHLTSGVDIGVVAQDVAQKRIGRYLTPDELSRFTQVYHGQEANYQAADYNQGQVGAGGGTATKPASLDAAAQQFAEAAHPVEAGAQRQVELFKKVADMFTQGPQGVSQTGI